MVKNLGGNKAKRQARKFVAQPNNRNTRFITEKGELYAKVLRLYGGSNCEVICMDGVTRLCIMRNKFRGRHKKDNTIANGVWVLVGTREWEVRPHDAVERCDLLEIYNEVDIEKIKSNTTENISCLMADDETKADDNITFANVDTVDSIDCDAVNTLSEDEEIDLDEI